MATFRKVERISCPLSGWAVRVGEGQSLILKTSVLKAKESAEKGGKLSVPGFLCTILKKLYLLNSMFGVEVVLGLINAISIFTNLTDIYLEAYDFRISIRWKSVNCSYYIQICINHQDYNQIQVGLPNGIWYWPLRTWSLQKYNAGDINGQLFHHGGHPSKLNTYLWKDTLVVGWILT
ncbi:unnamed protein product [Lactuca saligna]|uniref:Uncharacterized protein n=1 Tax=Lactuca saligna TaxID=75948 RepID=A0AA36EB83_LACSI|nr:unnamed protein product [Lactuca saligna]